MLAKFKLSFGIRVVLFRVFKEGITRKADPRLTVLATGRPSASTRMAEIQDGADSAKILRTVGPGSLKNIALGKIQNEIVTKAIFKSGC